MNFKVTLSSAVAVFFVSACAGDISGPGEGQPLEGVKEDETTSLSAELSTSVPIGSTLQTTTSLNLRTGPSTGYSVRLVIPSGGKVTTVNRTTPSNGWYNIKYGGTVGWSYGGYLKLVSSPSVHIGDHTRDGAVMRARSAVGKSYYWGHARWVPFGSGKGSCAGSCPSCSHSGTEGADCSGYVAKLWQVPSTNTDLTHDWHPYSTYNFNLANSQWHTVSRSSVIKADAMVYNSGGEGHIFLYESGSGWGSFWAYEAKGCSYGIRHNIRTASSIYHAIRHY
jgi:hypothetical protein